LVKALGQNANIGACCNYMLSPVVHSEATLGVLVPYKFALTSFGVALSRQEILATITIEVNPESHVIKIPVNIVGHGVRGDGFSDVNRVHLDEVDTTVALAGRDEAIGHHDDALTEDIHGDRKGIVGPQEAGGVKPHRA